MKYFSLLALSLLFLNGCSITYVAKRDHVAEKTYELEIQGNAFTTNKHLEEELLIEAEELCGKNNYRIESNYYVYNDYTLGISSIPKNCVEAKVICLEEL